MTRIIAHVDMDAFYASVEQREHSELKGKPVIVGGTPQQRGVVAAASYEVRRFGVHSAMPTVTALRLCPHATLLPPRMSRYKEVSQEISKIYQRMTPLVEPLSLDEAFLDLSHSAKTVKDVKQLAQQIKAQILEQTKLTCSVGIAPNKFLAKLSSEQNKPDGLFILRQHNVRQFLDQIPLSKLWGVGPATHKRLQRMGIETMPQLHQCPLPKLVRYLGAQGAHLWQLARGQDNRAVLPDRPYKSISRETTFANDLTDTEEMKKVLKTLCAATMKNVRHNGLQGKTLHVKVRLDDFTTLTRNATLAWPTQEDDTAWHTVERLFDSRVDLQQQGVRLLGVGISSLSERNSGQLPLFALEQLIRP